jgi:hypothetical protein
MAHRDSSWRDNNWVAIGVTADIRDQIGPTPAGLYQYGRAVPHAYLSGTKYFMGQFVGRAKVIT